MSEKAEVEEDDGVKRDGLDYRAGFIEGVNAFLQQLQIASIRAKSKEVPGLEASHKIALEVRKVMIEKMKG